MLHELASYRTQGLVVQLGRSSNTAQLVLFDRQFPKENYSSPIFFDKLEDII